MSNYSRVIAGAMHWGIWGKNFSLTDMSLRIRHCIELGLTTFDHADIYGGYTTEADFGRAFRASGISRDKVQFITKCGIQYLAENRNNSIKHYDYSSEYIVWSAEQSLQKLQTDYLDLFLLHRPSPLMHPDEIAKAIDQLKTQGKIKDFGVSNFTNSQMALVGSKNTIATNQIEFSLTAFDAMHDGTLDYMLQHNILPMAWSPLGSIFKEENEQTLRIHNTLDTLTEKYNATKDQLVLAWILKHPSGIYPVVGTSDLKRLELASEATTIDLELEDWFTLLVASQGHKVP